MSRLAFTRSCYATIVVWPQMLVVTIPIRKLWFYCSLPTPLHIHVVTLVVFPSGSTLPLGIEFGTVSRKCEKQ